MNAEIAERIFGWEVYRKERRYRMPAQTEGVLQALPDFLARTDDHDLLRRTMQHRGWELTVAEDGPDVEKEIGKTFTASYRRQNETFEDTETDERLAVCVAALKAHGS